MTTHPTTGFKVKGKTQEGREFVWDTEEEEEGGGGSADPPLFALDVDAWGGCSTFPSKRLKTHA